MDNLWKADKYDAVLRSLSALPKVAAQERVHAITYHDVRAPGEPAGNALPATDLKWDQPSAPGFAFRVQTGSTPEAERKVRLEIEWAQPVPSPATVRTYLNAHRLTLAEAVEGVWRFDVPAGALEDEAQVIEIETPGKDTVVRVELHVAAR